MIRKHDHARHRRGTHLFEVPCKLRDVEIAYYPARGSRPSSASSLGPYSVGRSRTSQGLLGVIAHFVAMILFPMIHETARGRRARQKSHVVRFAFPERARFPPRDTEFARASGTRRLIVQLTTRTRYERRFGIHEAPAAKMHGMRDCCLASIGC